MLAGRGSPLFLTKVDDGGLNPEGFGIPIVFGFGNPIDFGCDGC